MTSRGNAPEHMPVVPCDMDAFDALPPEIRAALHGATVNWAPQDLLEMLQRTSAALTLSIMRNAEKSLARQEPLMLDLGPIKRRARGNLTPFKSRA